MLLQKIAASLSLAIVGVGFSGNLLVEEKADATQDPALKQVNSANFKNLGPYYDMWMASKKDSKFEDMTATHPGFAILQADKESATGSSLNGLRGHYYAWLDFAASARTGEIGSRCLLCHSSGAPAIIERDGELALLSKTWKDYAKEGANTIGCSNCHDTNTFQLRVAPKWLDKELQKAGLPTFAESSKTVQKRLVCAQCHYEDYRTHQSWKDKDGKELTADLSTTPWKYGFTLDAMERFYNDGKNFSDGKPFVDIVNPISKTPLVWVEHPDFELFTVGIHGKNGLACTDCHMGKDQKTGITNHTVGNPLENFENTCARCHDKPKQFYVDLLGERKAKARKLRDEAIENIAKAHLDAGAAWKAGATEAEMAPVLADIRSAYFKLNSLIRAAWFHNTEEAFNGLADALYKSERARRTSLDIMTKHGVKKYVTPSIKTKEEAEAIVGVKNRHGAIAQQCKDYEKEVPEIIETARKAGLFDENSAWNDHVDSWIKTYCPKPTK